jgi:hypothetical protein
MNTLWQRFLKWHRERKIKKYLKQKGKDRL